MESIKKILEMRENQLLQIKSKKEKAIENAPEGSLRICANGKRVQYKISLYEQNGIFVGDKLILTYETKAIPINQKHVATIIQHYLL